MDYKLGIMGGTFDPIHIGHLAAASEAMQQYNLDEVVFIPALPSHKKDRKIENKEHRYTMVQLAVANNPLFTVSRIDIDRGKETYTIDTLTDLQKERGPGTKLYFITGADVLNDIEKWENSEGIFEKAQFIGVSRSGFNVEKETINSKINYCHIPEIAMSSTEIRHRVKENQPLYYWLPDTVIGYIGKHGLYGANWSKVKSKS